MLRAPILLCALAFLCAALLGYLRFQSEKARALAESQLAAETTRASTLAVDLARTREQRTALEARLAVASAELANAQAALTAAEARTTELDRELVRTQATLAVHETHSLALATELASSREELADIRHAFATLEGQAATARSGRGAFATPEASTVAFTNRAGQARVVGVGPQNAFVVLDFGAERGAQLGHKLDVNQGTEPIATVLISDVRPNFSIAQVLPDTLRGVLQKGDQAILLRSP